MKEFTRMNTNSKRLSIYIVLMLLLTCAAVTLRSIACISSLNMETGYFTDKSLTTVSDIIIWVAVLASVSYIFVASKTNISASFSTPATYIPTGLVGVSTLFLGARILYFALNKFNRYPIISQETLTSPVFVMSVLAFVLAIISVGYYFFNTYSTESKLEVRAFFSISAIAFLAIYAMLIYFDESLPINNSGKAINQMAYLFAAIFFLYEARISLGREMWRPYCAFGLAGAALTAYSSIPSLITYYTTGNLPFASHAGAFTSMEEYMLTLALFIFIVSKLVLTVTLKEDEENEYIKAMFAFATQRSAEVEESYARFQEDFAKQQMSIFELYGDEDTAIEEDSEEDVKEDEKEESNEEPTISDDVIYESIFGRMPDRENKDEETPKEEEIADGRDPEEIADGLLNAIEEVENTSKEEQ